MSRDRPKATAPPLGADGSPLIDSKTVLVVSSNAKLAGELSCALQNHGMPALLATAPRWVLHWLREVPPALVLLDMAAPGAPKLVDELRREGRHVVALSDDVALRQRALAAGCLEAHHRSDPANELAMHLATLLRTRKVRRIGRIVAGPLVVDLTRRTLILGDRLVKVSPLLLDLAAYFAARPGQIVDSRTLLAEVWGEVWDHRPIKVAVAILRLRRVLGIPADSEFLVGRQGHGYGLFPEAAVTPPRHSEATG